MEKFMTKNGVSIRAYKGDAMTLLAFDLDNNRKKNFVGFTIKALKAFIAGIVTFLVFGFLFWKHFHGGVTSHHILHQQDLPSISNWWSGLLFTHSYLVSFV